MRLAACTALFFAACSFRHRFVPVRPISAAAADLRVTVEHIAIDSNHDTEVALRVDSDRPVDVDGLAASIRVRGDATAATLDQAHMTGGPNAELVALLYNAITTAYARAIAKCANVTSCVARIHFPIPFHVPLDEPTDLTLVLDHVITRTFGPLPVPELALSHRGDAADALREQPEAMRTIALFRFGGGVSYQHRGFGALPSMNLEADLGKHWGPFALAGVLACGEPTMLGVDARYTFERGSFALSPFAGYGFHASPINAQDSTGEGQGVRLGIDIVARPTEHLLGVPVKDFAIGGYVLAAESFFESGPSTTIQAGLSVGFF